MNFPRQQKGMSMWQLAYVLGSLGIFGMVAVKCIPVYSDNIKIKRAVQKTATAGISDPYAVEVDLARQWAIEDINSMNFKAVKVKRAASGGAVLAYAYDASVPLTKGVALVFSFEGNEPVNAASGP